MIKGLFINTKKANCSIHESGTMAYNALKLGNSYLLEYTEVDEHFHTISAQYDFYVFNYHHWTMVWLDTKEIKSLPGLKATIVLEVLPNNPFVLCPKDDFDAYLVMDPTISLPYKNIFAFPRPLEQYTFTLPTLSTIPVIGSFGFATKGKYFDKVIDAVNYEFDTASIRINIPKGTYINQSYHDELINSLKRKSLNSGINLEITNDYLDKDALVKWLAQNTLNVFLYQRHKIGLSATTDQAICSGRPLAVSTDPTFRHIHKYIKPYPFRTLKESIEKSIPEVLKMKEDWSPKKFATKFEHVLDAFKVQEQRKQLYVSNIKLKPLPKIKKWHVFNRIQLIDFAPPIFSKVARKIGKNKKQEQEQIKIAPFVCSALNSYSQFNEDIFIDYLLNKERGVYIDVGANDPNFNSNTKRFYLKGWTGINIEPNFYIYDKLLKFRANDMNLNIAVSKTKGEIKIYHMGYDSTLSTLNYDIAKEVSAKLKLPILEAEILAFPLRDIFNEYLNGREIDFLSVDAEGHDLSVLESNDWNGYRPTLLMVESCNQYTEILEFMASIDYLHIYNNNINTIFIDKKTMNNSVLEKLVWH